MVMTLIEPSKGKKIRKKIIILSVVTLVVIWFGAKFYHILKYEETDNAQIEGDIVPVRTVFPGILPLLTSRIMIMYTKARYLLSSTTGILDRK